VGESRSEQNEPLRDESADELRLLVLPPDTLKKLLSWATALFMSAELTVMSGYDHMLLLLLLLMLLVVGPPNMGSCLTGAAPFFSGVVGAGRSSSRAWMKWQRGPYGQKPTLW